MYNVLRNVKCCMVLYIDLNCILRIYSATQGYNVLLCCIMIKVAVGDCLVLWRGERGIWACVFKEFTLRCKETWSPIIERTYSLLLNLLTRQRLPLNKYYSNLSFLNQFCQNSFPGFSSRLHPRWRLPTLWSLWIGLPPSCIRNVGGPWAGVWPIPNKIIEEALIWTLKDSLPSKCTDYMVYMSPRLRGSSFAPLTPLDLQLWWEDRGDQTLARET